MKKIIGLLLGLVFFTFNAEMLKAKESGNTLTSFRQSNVCRVDDPTGTPLNVRSAPITGRVVSKLKNGTVVRVEDFNETAGDETAQWWKISIVQKGKRKTLGWVFSEYLRCG